MDQRQIFLRSCSSLGVGGLRMGDRVEIHPLQGRKRGFVLKKNEYDFFTASTIDVKGEGMEWALPSFPSEKGYRLRMQFVACPHSDEREDGRYWIKSLNGRPFRINGVYTMEAWLMRGQILDFAHNRMIFCGGKSSRQTSFLEQIPKKVVGGRMNILLEGETGTGKSHLAKMIHDASGVTGSFVHLNLAAFSSSLIESELFGHVQGAFTGAVKSRRGAFEMAHRGTLFLDEIDSLPLEIQTKLLLVLESLLIRPIGADFTRKVEPRLIFASGRPLLGLVEKKIFREDFYYRVQRGFFKRLPPLREMPELLEKIFCNFMEENNVSACPRLLEYYRSLKWPGNIRQLVSHLEKKVLLSDGCYLTVDREDEALENDSTVRREEEGEGEILPLVEMKRRYAYYVLKRLGGNYNKASRLLNVSCQTLKRMVTEGRQEALSASFQQQERVPLL